MNVSEDSLMARIATEVKRVLRQNRAVTFTPEHLADYVLRDPMVYREACLNGNGTFYRVNDEKVIAEPDKALVASWVDSTFRKFRRKARKFEKWIRQHYYVTKWNMNDYGYSLPHNIGHGLAGQ